MISFPHFGTFFLAVVFSPQYRYIYMVHENIFYEVQACIVILHIYNTLNRLCICKDTLYQPSFCNNTLHRPFICKNNLKELKP
jgi:hypothetical protein